MIMITITVVFRCTGILFSSVRSRLGAYSP